MSRTGYGLPGALFPGVNFIEERYTWTVVLLTSPSMDATEETLDAAIRSMVDSLRAYAEDWHDHLSAAPKHRDNYDLVSLVEASDDARLRGWLYAEHWEQTQ